MPLENKRKFDEIDQPLKRQLDEFQESLLQAIDNKQIRSQILAQLNTGFKILTDNQLKNIYRAVLSILQDNTKISSLAALLTDLHSNVLIRRKDDSGNIRDLRLTRSVSISITEAGCELSLLPSRKIATGEKMLPKFKGTTASVTQQFDITPLHVNRLSRVMASKSVNMAPSNYEDLRKNVEIALSNYEGLMKNIEIAQSNCESLRKNVEIIQSNCEDLRKNVEITQSNCEDLRKNVEIAHKMGHHVSVSRTGLYHHYKGEEKHAAIRVTEEWAPYTLFDFSKKNSLLSQNIKLKPVSILTLIGEILFELRKLHEDLKVVHNDIKSANILIYFDEHRNIHARLTDFNLSEYMETIQNHKLQPVATCTYASPQVVGFTVLTPYEKLSHQDLFHHFKKKQPDCIYSHGCFGRELLYCNLSSITNKDEYKDFKQDYKDDMFSLGVTLFMFITGHYPVKKNSLSLDYPDFPNMLIDQAYIMYPQYQELFEGLFALDRDQRFNIQEALAAYQRISIPQPQPATYSSQIFQTPPPQWLAPSANPTTKRPKIRA